MATNKDLHAPLRRFGMPTSQFARSRLVKPQTVRKRYSKTGSYFGVKPMKLENGRLSWPDEAGVSA